jgi:hypothetical protein
MLIAPRRNLGESPTGYFIRRVSSCSAAMNQLQASHPATNAPVATNQPNSTHTTIICSSFRGHSSIGGFARGNHDKANSLPAV